MAKRGRPRKFENGGVRTALRIGRKDLALLDRAAHSHGITRSDLIRLASVGAARAILNEQPVNSVP